MKKATFGKALCVLAVGFFCLNANGQNEHEYLKKYWNYRQKLQKYFVKIGKGDGKSICFDNIDNNQYNDFSNSTFWGNTPKDPVTQSVNGYRKMGDAMAQHGEYLSVLATQYKLLVDAGKDVQATLNEIYYALVAVQRVDENAERFFDPLGQPTNNNGFFIRDDANQNLANEWLTEYPNTQDNRDNYYGISSNYYRDIAPNAINMNNEMSQDQLFGLMQGFLFIKKFIGHVYVQPKPTDAGFFLDDKVSDITQRCMNYITTVHHRTNHHNELLKFDMADLNWLYLLGVLAPIPHMGPVIIFPHNTQTIYTTCEVDENWMILNPVTQQKVANGSEMRPFAYPISKAGELITGVNYTSAQNQASRIKYTTTDILFDNDFCIPFNLNIPIDDVFGSHWWQLQFLGELLTPNTMGENTMHFCVTIYEPVANIPHPLGNEPINVCFKSFNMFMMLQLASMTGTWSHSKVSEISENWHMEIFDLMYAVLNNTTPIHPKSFWENILNSAPCQGPYNIRLTDSSLAVISHNYDPNGWFENTRWAGAVTPSATTFGEFNGNDYMLLYNLYRIAYANQLTQTEYTDISCPCENSPKLEANISAGVLQANTNVKRKFANDYLPIGIKLKEYSIHPLTVPAQKELTVETDLIICNNSNLTINLGGKVTVGNATVAPSSIIVREGSSITINNKGKLIINDNHKVIIEKGAKLYYQAGAEIELLGDNALLEIQGDLILGNNSIFKFTYPNTNSGYVKFSKPDYSNPPYDQIRVASPGQTAGVELRGKNKADKILEVAQDLLQVTTANGISSFKIEHGTVEYNFPNQYNSNPQISHISSDANVRIFNASFVSNPSTIGRMAVWGQSQCQISNSDLNLYGYLFVNGHKLDVTKCTGGIYTQGRGVNIYSCKGDLTTELANYNSFAKNSDFSFGSGA
ncbi:MAG: hypothetical protein JNL69_03895, partial [Bacteroidia bacterium]|nr:hypothetical protein [Bacteroidia bacterium]